MRASAIGMGAGMTSAGASMGLMAYAGIGASLDPSSNIANQSPWTPAFLGIPAAGMIVGAGAGAAAGFGASLLARRFAGPIGAMGRSKFGKYGGAIGGAIVGAGLGLMAGRMAVGTVKSGAYTGGSMGATGEQTRMSGSLASISQLRADIARLHRPIRGMGY